MKCPRCEEGGIRSRVYVPQVGISTCIGYETYYDEDGEYHSHDPNTHSQQFRCSEGHRFQISQTSKCPSCDYGGGSRLVVFNEAFNESARLAGGEK